MFSGDLLGVAAERRQRNGRSTEVSAVFRAETVRGKETLGMSTLLEVEAWVDGTVVMRRQPYRRSGGGRRAASRTFAAVTKARRQGCGDSSGGDRPECQS